MTGPAHPCAVLLADERDAARAAGGGLDEAWAEAENALPDEWAMHGVEARVYGSDGTPQYWESSASYMGDDWDEEAGPETIEVRGPTPVAALRALRAALDALTESRP